MCDNAVQSAASAARSSDTPPLWICEQRLKFKEARQPVVLKIKRLSHDDSTCTSKARVCLSQDESDVISCKEQLHHNHSHRVKRPKADESSTTEAIIGSKTSKGLAQ
ncbi:uncharacterized protein LOC27206572 isoform X1 [Drosophila simulans]|uniref:uncharacterized protein LOC27206572 isoform X1 n=1 Tax=Drosophila simulans TaxID=7240 RepID=UPI00192CE81A|nr:uncharacterized protein LOC27206572 isoform X1 [Drosophila simulans]